MDFVGIGFIVFIYAVAVGVTFFILAHTRRLARYAVAICLITVAITGLGFFNSQTKTVRTASSLLTNSLSSYDICENAPKTDQYCYETIHTRGFPLQSVKISVDGNDEWRVGPYRGARVGNTTINYLIVLALVVAVFYAVDLARNRTKSTHKRK